MQLRAIKTENRTMAGQKDVLTKTIKYIKI